MVRKFGVSLDEDVADRVEERMEFGDKRSERIQHLIEAGLAVEEQLDAEVWQVSIDQPRDVRAFVREVFDNFEE